jgi:hypothetical protein
VVSILSGLLAGFLGSVAIAILMMATSKGQPGVNAMLVGRALGKPPTDPKARAGGMVAHFAYGTAMGVVFVAGSDAFLVAGSLWITGLLFGILLFLIAALVVMPAAGVNREMMKRMPKGRFVGFLVFHLIYGGILAVVVVALPQV